MNAEEIISLRATLGITQEKFAALLGTCFSTVNRWEKGKTIPSRLYIKELKELRRNHGSHIRRRKKFKDS